MKATLSVCKNIQTVNLIAVTNCISILIQIIDIIDNDKILK